MNEFACANKDGPTAFLPVYSNEVVDSVGERSYIPDHLGYTGNLAPISTQFLRRVGPSTGSSGASTVPVEYLMYSGNLPVISKQFYRAGTVCARLWF